VGMVGWGLWGLGAVVWLLAGSANQSVMFASAPSLDARPRGGNLQGDPSWRKGRPASPSELHVISSTQSARAGERISVEVSAREPAVVRAEVFRLGVYGGTGAAKVWSSEPLTVSIRPRCAQPSCRARQTFSFEISRDWVPGLYLVKVTRADGLRSFTSLVVKEREAQEPRS
jgi:hypothetical protein